MYPNDWQDKMSIKCLKEISEVFEEEFQNKDDLFGPIFLFESLRDNKEYAEILQSLCAPFDKLPLFVSSEFETVKLILRKRIKFMI